MNEKELHFISLLFTEPVSFSENHIREVAHEADLTYPEAYKVLELPEIKSRINLVKAVKCIDAYYVLGNIKNVAEISLANDPIPNSDIREYDPQYALKALELLGKNQKLFTDKVESLSVQTSFEEYIKRVEDENEY